MSDTTTIEAKAVSDPEHPETPFTTPGATVLTPTVTGGRTRTMFVPVKNEPGVQMRIDKSRLVIDPLYQRKLNERRVGQMAANWSWVSCGVLSVSQRPGADKWFIFDGQHRFAAASWVDGISDLPCIVFELDTIKEEAISFLAANVERRMPTLSDQFRALLIAGDPVAESMDRLASAYSRSFGGPSDGTHISCVSTMAVLTRQNRAAMERVFPVLAEVARGRPLTSRLFKAFHWLERCMPRGESLADERWHRRIVHVGYDAINEQIRQIWLIDRGRGGSRPMALGLVQAINRGLQQKLDVNLERPRR